MIALVEGSVASRGFDEVVVLTSSGVGYRLHVSLQTLASLPEEGGRVRLHVHTSVREDAIQLFGFHDAAERQAFQLLTSVSGIGPRLALAVLSGFAVPDLAVAVRGGDIKRLSSVPGVGKKTAERMVLELREKFGQLEVPGAPGVPRGPLEGIDRFDDLRSALSNLGYRGQDVDRIVARVEKELGTKAPPAIEELVRLALRLAR